MDAFAKLSTFGKGPAGATAKEHAAALEEAEGYGSPMKEDAAPAPEDTYEENPEGAANGSDPRSVDYVKRMFTIQYDVKAPLTALFSWKNTEVRTVLRSKECYFFAAFTLAVCLVEIIGGGNIMPDLTYKNFAMVETMLIFLLVFFHEYCYQVRRERGGERREAARKRWENRDAKRTKIGWK